MKKKFSSMGRVAIALVLALSLSLVMAVPVAANVTEPTVAVDPVTLDTAAEYTIGFDVITGLALNTGSITVKFPVDTTVPTSYTAGDITVETAGGGPIDVPAANISVTGQEVTITTPVAISGEDSVEVIFEVIADIINPTTGGNDYTLEVKTSQEPTFVPSAVYTIGVLPVVTGVSPASGNVNDTMWVEVTGSGFVEDGTTFAFGDYITVVSTKYVDVDEIDCQITISEAGAARYVIPTTWGEGTNATAEFDPNLEFTAQVDVWLQYTPDDDDPFVADTLEFDITKDNITDGIAAATAESSTEQQVLIVHAATYTENPVIDNDYITIKSLSGADNTIIDGSVGLFGVTLEGIGLTIEDLTINRGGSVGGLAGVKLSEIMTNLVGDGFTIKGCTFSDWGRTGDDPPSGGNDAVIGGYQFGLFHTGAEVTGGRIEGNTFSGNSRTAIWLETSGGFLDGLVIKDNYLLGCIQTNNGHGIRLQGEIGKDTAGAASIEGNTISDMSGTAIILRVETLSGTDTGEVTITDNDISNCYQGVEASAAWIVTITENTILNCRENGIKIGSGDQGAKVIKYNDISGNTEYGLKNEDTGDIIDAKYNWWGEIGGPSDDPAVTDTTALGNGDVVTLRVTYDPWLTETQTTTVEDGIAYFGSTMELQSGWNTLSVPLKLKSTANTLTKIDDLGDFLTSTNWENAYQYNPVLTPEAGGWETPTELVPGRGYYIKTLAIVSFPVLYNGQLSLPTYDLDNTGWNLIGSMFGIDTDTSDPGDDLGDYGIAAVESLSGEMQLKYALESIKANTSVVVSPYLPGQLGAFGTTTELEEWMQVGEGYWVFMEATDTLAGFEVTPIHKVFLP